MGAKFSQLIILFHFVMFRMEWLQGKAVEFILKILSSKLDGTSSIFLEKVTILLYSVLICSPFCLIFVLITMEYFWGEKSMLIINPDPNINPQINTRPSCVSTQCVIVSLQ